MGKMDKMSIEMIRRQDVPSHKKKRSKGILDEHFLL